LTGSSSGVLRPEHHVKFFETDEDLAGTVALYLARALQRDGSAAAIATRHHQDLLLRSLSTAGVDVGSALDDGRLSFHDAAEILACVSHGTEIDPVRFGEVIGALVTDAGEGAATLHVYGEMVGLLWDEGEVASALALEGLWNDLDGCTPFSLLCGYAAGSFDDPVAADAFSDVCHHHTVVLDGAPVPAQVDAFRHFPRAHATPRSARRFVRDTLVGWGCQDLTDEAMLAVSELATNAVVHAGSNVSVGLARHEDAVRLVVGDTSTDPPVPTAANAASLNGRGLYIIDGLAREWGHELSNGGKLVWIDFNCPRSSA
jgi:anti-sigma regulatory factor (Ser/Thr protein kinase)